MSYNLTISRYGRYLSFDTLEELKEELSLYFSPKEKESGIIEKLTNFDSVKEQDGFKQINYQDFTICCYME